MPNIRSKFVAKKHQASSLLRAIFEDGVVSFRVSDVATLEDIGNRLDGVRALHFGVPISINLTFNAPEDDRPTQLKRWLSSSSAKVSLSKHLD